MPETPKAGRDRHPVTSLDKALEVCEALSGARRGLSVTELARTLRLPAPTVHRLLRVLKRRGYVRQDEETSRYSLTLKMLDLSFRLLGRSELRLHAYPVLREYVLRSGQRAFVAVPAAGEVTYIWNTGPDEVGMYTAFGKQMPGHCSIYFDPSQRTRRLSCLRMPAAREAGAEPLIVRLGQPSDAGEQSQRLICACAPVHDYSSREVARVGIFAHRADERPLVREHTSAAWELARLISMRLGYLPAGVAVGA
jgi:DNA-binding IclR family transcriptional regulator